MPGGIRAAAITTDTYLSDVTWDPGTASNGYGPIELNRSNGGKNAGDGKTLTIGGKTFAKGLGVHATSSVSYTLGAGCTYFSATLGVDDEVGDRGSVVFEIWNGTATRLYQSLPIRGIAGPLNLSLPINGVSTLRLVVRDAGDGISSDHADWADARVTCPPPTPGGWSYLSDLGWSSPTNAWGPIERDRSNGEKLSGDGRTLTIGGRTYVKGLGMHANASVSYLLSGRCSTFSAQVGVDDEVGDKGSVLFRVYGDGRELLPAVLRRGTDGPQALDVNVRGVRELRLVAADNGDGIGADHADWADARVSCPGYTVNAIYLRPADRPDRSAVYRPAIERALTHLQRWYAEQLGGPTFEFAGVRAVTSSKPAGWFANEVNGADFGSRFFYNALQEALDGAGIARDDANIWLVYVDADPLCGQIGGGAIPQRAVMSANDPRGLVGFSTETFVKTCPDEPDGSFDQPVLRWVGGSGHELGHALGLDHPQSCDDACQRGNLMGLGYLRYPATALSASDRRLLAASPFVKRLTLAPPPTSLRVRAYNIDDISRVFVNGQRMVQFGYNDDSGVVDLSPWVGGPATVRLTTENTGDGYTYGFTVVSNGTTILQQACGTSGSVACAEDGRIGVVYDQTLTIP